MKVLTNGAVDNLLLKEIEIECKTRRLYLCPECNVTTVSGLGKGGAGGGGEPESGSAIFRDPDG